MILSESTSALGLDKVPTLESLFPGGTRALCDIETVEVLTSVFDHEVELPSARSWAPGTGRTTNADDLPVI